MEPAASESPPPPAAALSSGAGHRGELRTLLVVWLALSAVVTGLALRNLSAPGLYYDEAVYAGLAKDFLDEDWRGQHMPGIHTVNVFGRPLPLLVQGYLGGLKAWLTLPGVAALGANVAAVRLTSVAWLLLALLLFLLWARRLLGLPAALLAGPLLGLDPAFFFASVLDWGPSVPSFLCRFGGFYFALRWWQERKAWVAFVAGACLGLGFFNKVDFVVILAGTGGAAVIANCRAIVSGRRQTPAAPALGAAGFVIGASPMLLRVPELVAGVFAAKGGRPPTETWEKLHTALALLDGSYFHRLMEAGGMFLNMFGGPCGAWVPLGGVLVLAVIFLAVKVGQGIVAKTPDRSGLFLVLSLAALSAGVLLLPGAVRIHHALLVYPFPQLIIAAAVVALWRASSAAGPRRIAARALAAAAAAALLAANVVAILKTQQLMRVTGGRGLWANALHDFCAQVKGRADLTIVSMDWGFNEQLRLLAPGPKLIEPVWDLQNGARLALPRGSNAIYLVRGREFSVFPFGVEVLNSARAADPQSVSIQPYRDRQGDVAFYAIRFFKE
jgi:hypothetical protein